MKKSHILATVSTIALGAMIGMSQPALANNNGPHYQPPKPPLFTGVFAFAYNSGAVAYNWAWTLGGGNTAEIVNNTADNAQGVIQINQNAGPNSLLQNAAAIAAVEAHAGLFTVAVADSYNWGAVYGSGNASWRYYSNNSALISGSLDDVEGVLNVNQNAGDNSLLQNSTALATFEECNCVGGPTLFSGAFAFSSNEGDVEGNESSVTGYYSSYSWGYGRSTASIDGSLDGSEGILQVNQNVGANSLLQNSAAVASIEANGGPVLVAVAFSSNYGDVDYNSSERYDAYNSASITDSLTRVRGIVNVNQNAGDNSLLQNSTAVASFEDCLCGPHGSAVGTFAYSSNDGWVGPNWADSSYSTASATINGSGNGAQGVIQVNQNAGANSLLQNSTAVASILARPAGLTAEVSHAFNWGFVAGNTSYRSHSSNSANISNSFNGSSTQGVIQVNQNAGDNSLLQNSTAIAALRYCGTNCASVNLAAVSVAGNYGSVSYNGAHAYSSNAHARISNSFNGAQGVINVNQNAGANSLLQNAASISSIRPH